MDQIARLRLSGRRRLHIGIMHEGEGRKQNCGNGSRHPLVNTETKQIVKEEDSAYVHQYISAINFDYAEPRRVSTHERNDTLTAGD